MAMKLRKNLGLLLFFGLVASYSCRAQYIPGSSYFDDNEYIEYRAGNMPIIILAPHGGYLEPDNIPDRDCEGCVYVRDFRTQEMSIQMFDTIHERSGCYPHVIINRLRRTKLDANRDIGDAADGNPLAEEAWRKFHEYVDDAKEEVERKFGKGILLDMHGHGHTAPRIELGYRIPGSGLRLTDQEINATYHDRTCIAHLVQENLPGQDLAQLLRGRFAFGTLLEENNLPSVPSMQDPAPKSGESYFSGGYNVGRHGSRDSGNIDAIQMECHRPIRQDDQRAEAVGQLITALFDFINLHYDSSFFDKKCVPVSTDNSLSDVLEVYPNPLRDEMIISSDHSDLKSCTVFNQVGQKIIQVDLNHPKTRVNTSHWKSGMYIIRASHGGKMIHKKMIKIDP